MRQFYLIVFVIALVVFQSGCNARVLVKPDDVPSADTEFAYVLVGVRYDKDDGLLSGWNMLWARQGPDVEWNSWTGHDPSDLVWLANSSFMAVEPDNGVQYFLRKVRPGPYAFLHSVRFVGRQIMLTPGDERVLEFDAVRGKLTYVGTMTFGFHPKFPALIPISLEDDSVTAFQHVTENFAISLPRETALMTFTDMSRLDISRKK